MSANEAYLEDLREARELEEVQFAGRCTTALLLRFIEMIASLLALVQCEYTYIYTRNIYVHNVYV